MMSTRRREAEESGIKGLPKNKLAILDVETPGRKTEKTLEYLDITSFCDEADRDESAA